MVLAAVVSEEMFRTSNGIHTESVEAGHYVTLGRAKGVLIKAVILIPVHDGRNNCAIEGTADPIATERKRKAQSLKERQPRKGTGGGVEGVTLTWGTSSGSALRSRKATFQRSFARGPLQPRKCPTCPCFTHASTNFIHCCYL